MVEVEVEVVEVVDVELEVVEVVDVDVEVVEVVEVEDVEEVDEEVLVHVRSLLPKRNSDIVLD